MQRIESASQDDERRVTSRPSSGGHLPCGRLRSSTSDPTSGSPGRARAAPTSRACHLPPKVGRGWRFAGARSVTTSIASKAYVEMQEEETGEWRGYVVDGEAIEETDYFGEESDEAAEDEQDEAVAEEEDDEVDTDLEPVAEEEPDAEES